MVEVFVPGKGWSSLYTGGSTKSESLPNDLESLVRLKEELESRKFHLDRSNKEMLIFDSSGEDAELQDAIKENNAILVETERRIDMVDTKIKERGGVPAAKGEASPVASVPNNTPCGDVVSQDCSTTNQDDGLFL
eukprot:Lankesteria_metandrocarpae@DN4896_c0_g1_i2.p1